MHLDCFREAPQFAHTLLLDAVFSEFSWLKITILAYSVMLSPFLFYATQFSWVYYTSKKVTCVWNRIWILRSFLIRIHIIFNQTSDLVRWLIHATVSLGLLCLLLYATQIKANNIACQNEKAHAMQTSN